MPTPASSDQGDQLARIQAVVDAALSHLDLEDLLDQLLLRIRDALETDTAAFLLLDESTNELVARAAHGLEEEVEVGTRIPVGRGFAGTVAAEQRVVFIPDVDHADVLNPILREKGVKSLLGAPLLVRGRVLGVVHVGTLTPRAFTDADAELLRVVADRAALAIDHGRAFEAERALAERLRRLQAVTDVALTHLSTDDLLEELVIRVREILGADTCAILLLDEDRREVVARAAAGLEEEVEAGVRIPLGRGFAGRVAAERRTIAILDIDEADIVNPILRQKGIRSLLGSPLLARGRVLGVIHVGSLRERRFTDEEAELLQTAAERAALGLERALLHERLLEIDRIRHRFVAVASHELRTPTASVLGSAITLTQRRDRLTEDQRLALETILAEQATRLATLVEQLLDLSRVESMPVRRERVRLCELIEQVLGEVAEQRRDDVEVDVDESVEVETDALALGRILANLVANALRHGAPPVLVTAAAGGSGDLEVVVEDAGSGVPDEIRERVFDQFVRGESGAGSGLGLAIARSYAATLGGRLALEATGEGGARFRLVLPGRADEPDGGASPPTDSPPTLARA